MKNLVIPVFGFAILSLSSVNVSAAGSLQHLSQASVNSAQAIGHSAVAGVKIVSGVVAIPLTVAGEVGNVSGEAGKVLWEQTNRPIGEPLEITDAVITAGPSPEDVMQSQERSE